MSSTALRPLQEGGRQKADALVQSAKAAMAPYQDYRKALADGYEIFLPNIPQPQYHFTKREYGWEATSHFDPANRPRCSIRKQRTAATSWSGRCTPIGWMPPRTS